VLTIAYVEEEALRRETEEGSKEREVKTVIDR
jgi:hypothetical protein